MNAEGEMKREGGSEALQSASRALAVLELFESEVTLGTREIARRLDVSPAAAHRVVTTLAGRGFLEVDEVRREWRLGPKVSALAASIETGGVDLQRVAMPTLISLRDKVGETVALQAARQGCRVAVVQLESRHQLRMVVPTEPIPILFGPATDQIFRAYTDAASYTASTDPSPDVPDWERQFEAGLVEGPDLDAVRARGWAQSFGVRIPGGTSIAAPVVGHHETFVLSLFGPSGRLTDDLLETAGEEVRAAAASLTRTLSTVRINRFAGPPIPMRLRETERSSREME